jgi:hypothetical protein
MVATTTANSDILVTNKDQLICDDSSKQKNANEVMKLIFKRGVGEMYCV